RAVIGGLGAPAELAHVAAGAGRIVQRRIVAVGICSLRQRKDRARQDAIARGVDTALWLVALDRLGHVEKRQQCIGGVRWPFLVPAFGREEGVKLPEIATPAVALRPAQ